MERIERNERQGRGKSGRKLSCKIDVCAYQRDKLHKLSPAFYNIVEVFELKVPHVYILVLFLKLKL